MEMDIATTFCNGLYEYMSKKERLIEGLNETIDEKQGELETTKEKLKSSRKQLENTGELLEKFDLGVRGDFVLSSGRRIMCNQCRMLACKQCRRRKTNHG